MYLLDTGRGGKLERNAFRTPREEDPGGSMKYLGRKHRMLVALIRLLTPKEARGPEHAEYKKTCYAGKKLN